jgi:hypothetical protein
VSVPPQPIVVRVVSLFLKNHPLRPQVFLCTRQPETGRIWVMLLFHASGKTPALFWTKKLGGLKVRASR